MEKVPSWYDGSVRHFAVLLLAIPAIGLACGGSMIGNPNPNGAGSDGSDEAAETASVLAFQAILATHARDACSTRTSCGAADSVRAPFPHAPSEIHEVSWAVDHLSDDDPNDALATLIGAGLAAAQPALVTVRGLALLGRDTTTRPLAIATLGALGDVASLDVIERALASDSPALRAAAASAVRMLAAVTTFDSERVRSLALDDADFLVRCRIADALTLTSGSRVVPKWTKSEDDLFAIGTPLPTGRCATLAERFCTTMVAELDGDDCLIGLSWGGNGAVATFATEAIESYPHGTSVDGAPIDPLQIVTVAGERWVVSGSEETGHPAGAVHLLTRSTAGRLRAIALAAFTSIPNWYRVDGTTLVVQTSDGIVHRVTKRGAR
ncbi:hypothetical protein BH09MYX1_BH09MYX1_68350 [soil metagenome]